jgi:hypothetical protein
MASVLSREQWAEAKKMSLAGVRDVDIAHKFGIRTGTIRTRRYDDTEWLLAWQSQQSDRREAKRTPSPPSELSTETVGNASLEEIADENPRLIAGFSHAKIKESIQTNSIPAPQSWSELKTAVEILRKAVGLDKDQSPVQVNLWGGEADGVALYRDSGPIIETEPEEFV